MNIQAIILQYINVYVSPQQLRELADIMEIKGREIQANISQWLGKELPSYDFRITESITLRFMFNQDNMPK